MLARAMRDDQELEVKVDLSDTFANLLTIAKFSYSDQKLWSIAKKVKLQESLFPGKSGDPRLGISSVSDALKKFDETKTDEGLNTKAAAKGAAVDNANVWDEEEDGEEKATLSKDQYVAVARAMPDDCTSSMVAQISKHRAESEAFLKKDSLDSKCGRFKCGDKGK